MVQTFQGESVAAWMQSAARIHPLSSDKRVTLINAAEGCHSMSTSAAGLSTALTTIRPVAALHSAVLGEEFLPYSSAGRPFPTVDTTVRERPVRHIHGGTSEGFPCIFPGDLAATKPSPDGRRRAGCIVRHVRACHAAPHARDPGIQWAPERPALGAGRVLHSELGVRPVGLRRQRHLRLARGRRQAGQDSQGALVRGGRGTAGRPQVRGHGERAHAHGAVDGRGFGTGAAGSGY